MRIDPIPLCLKCLSQQTLIGPFHIVCQMTARIKKDANSPKISVQLTEVEADISGMATSRLERKPSLRSFCPSSFLIAGIFSSDPFGR